LVLNDKYLTDTGYIQEESYPDKWRAHIPNTATDIIVYVYKSFNDVYVVDESSDEIALHIGELDDKRFICLTSALL
jgi:hypothetical protein